MALILSIETSTPVCSVALSDENRLLAYAEMRVAQSHSSMLTSLIQQVLQNTQTQFTDIEAVALAKGPGSYTGLRIGTSTAKGICFAHDIPLIAINTLEVMTETVIAYYVKREESVLFCPMLDARRMEVYCALFDKDLHIVSPTEAKIIESDAFTDYLSEQPIHFFGNGAAKCQEIIQSDNAYFLLDIHPSAQAIAKRAFLAFSAKQFEDLAYFEPFYLKDFVGKKPKKVF